MSREGHKVMILINISSSASQNIAAQKELLRLSQNEKKNMSSYDKKENTQSPKMGPSLNLTKQNFQDKKVSGTPFQTKQNFTAQKTARQEGADSSLQGTSENLLDFEYDDPPLPMVELNIYVMNNI